MRFLFADAAKGAGYKKLTKHDMFSYHISRDKGCLRKEMGFGFKNIMERITN
jgi:hypothetical protein